MTGCELMWSQKTRRSEVSFQFELDKGISVPQLISKNLLHFVIGPQKVLDPRLKTIESPNTGFACKLKVRFATPFIFCFQEDHLKIWHCFHL